MLWRSQLTPPHIPAFGYPLGKSPLLVPLHTNRFVEYQSVAGFRRERTCRCVRAFARLYVGSDRIAVRRRDNNYWQICSSGDSHPHGRLHLSKCHIHSIQSQLPSPNDPSDYAHCMRSKPPSLPSRKQITNQFDLSAGNYRHNRCNNGYSLITTMSVSIYVKRVRALLFLSKVSIYV